MKLCLVAGVTVLVLAGCGTSTPARDQPGPEPTTAANVDGGCVRPSDHATVVHIATALGPTPGVLMGHGTHGVVITHASDGDLCQMLPLARLLADRGFHVLDWDPAVNPVTELAAATAILRRAGTTTVVLAGASYGAKASLIAATKIRPQVQAVLSMSAEADLGETPVAPAVHELHVPVLFLTAADDPYGSAAATKTFMRTCPSRHKKSVSVPGQDHGIDLLTGTHKVTIIAAILAFLHRYG